MSTDASIRILNLTKLPITFTDKEVHVTFPPMSQAPDGTPVGRHQALYILGRNKQRGLVRRDVYLARQENFKRLADGYLSDPERAVELPAPAHSWPEDHPIHEEYAVRVSDAESARIAEAADASATAEEEAAAAAAEAETLAAAEEEQKQADFEERLASYMERNKLKFAKVKGAAADEEGSK